MLHVRHTFQHIFVGYFSQQRREITKFEILTTPLAYHKSEPFILYSYSETARTNLITFRILRPHCATKTKWKNREKLTMVQSSVLS